MCNETKKCFIILLLFYLFFFFQVALQAQETADSWYLITESELRSIERFKTKSEADRQSWLLQAQNSKALSETLNSQLSQAREAQAKLRELYEASERERLTALSLKNGEIAKLKQELADKTLESQRHKSASTLRLFVIIALAAAIAGYIALRVLKLFRVFP